MTIQSSTKAFFLSYKWMLLTLLALLVGLFIIDCKKIYYVLTEVGIIFLPIVIFAKSFVIRTIVAVILSIIISAELSYFLLFSEEVTPAILSSVLQTHVNMGAKVFYPLLKFFIPLLIVFSLLFGAMAKELSFWPVKKQLVAILILLIFSSIGLYRVISREYKYIENFSLSNERLLLFLRDRVKEKFPLVVGNGFYLVAEAKEMAEIENNSQHDTWPEGVVLSEKSNTSPTKIIVVIGESSVSDHYSLYGYPFKTTPYLDKLFKENKISVTKAISGAPATRNSLRLALSYASPHDGTAFFQHKNIVEIAKQVSYETIWLSSTIERGVYGTYPGMVANSSDIFFESTTHPDLASEEDLVLPKLFNSFYKKGEKQFFVLHLQGSHSLYTDRYDEGDLTLSTTPEYTDYDRSIHHTDRMLAELITFINEHNESTVLFYFSDHGEVVNKGHGFQYASGQQYRIPFVTYQLNTPSIDMPALLEQYKSKHDLLNLINFSYIISEILGYDIKPELIAQAKIDGETVYHADNKVYLFEDIDSGKMPKPN